VIKEGDLVSRLVFCGWFGGKARNEPKGMGVVCDTPKISNRFHYKVYWYIGPLSTPTYKRIENADLIVKYEKDSK